MISLLKLSENNNSAEYEKAVSCIKYDFFSVLSPLSHLLLTNRKSGTAQGPASCVPPNAPPVDPGVPEESLAGHGECGIAAWRGEALRRSCKWKKGKLTRSLIGLRQTHYFLQNWDNSFVSCWTHCQPRWIPLCPLQCWSTTGSQLPIFSHQPAHLACCYSAAVEERKGEKSLQLPLQLLAYYYSCKSGVGSLGGI